MKYLKWIFRIFVLNYIFIQCLSCQMGDIDRNQQTANLSNVILLDPNPIPLSTITNNSTYMVIDTTGGNYLNNIKYLRSAGLDYLIVDDREIIYIVDKKGRVKSKFRHVGKGPGEYLEIAAITVDPRTQDIYLRGRRLNKLIKYNVHGDLLTEIQIQGYYIDHLTFEGSNLIGLSSFPSFLSNERSPEFVFIFDQNLNIIHTELHPIWQEHKLKYNYNPLMGIHSFKINEGLVFYEMYQNGQFYLIDIQNGWNIENWLQIHIENQLSDKDIIEANGYLSNPGIFSGKNYIENVVVTPDYLFLGVVYENIYNNIKSVLYDIRKNTFTTITDFAGYNRMWDDINGFFSFWPLGYLAQTNELYFYQQPGKMMQEYNEAIEISPNSFHVVDSNTLDLFENAKAMGNPVIQFVKLED